MVEWIQEALPTVDFSPLMTLTTNGRHNDSDFRLNIFDAHDVKTALTIAVSNAINCYAYNSEDPEYDECVPVIGSWPDGSHGHGRRRGRAMRGHHGEQASRQGRKFDLKGMLGKIITRKPIPSDDSSEEYYDYEGEEQPTVENKQVPFKPSSTPPGGKKQPDGRKQAQYNKGKQQERGTGNEIRQDPAQDRLDPSQPKEDPADDRWGHGGGFAMPTSSYDVGGYWGLRQPKGGCYCAIGSGGKGKHKKKPKDFSALYLLGLPLATFGTLTLGIIGLGLGFLLGQLLRQLFQNNNNGRIGDFLLRGKRDLANELEFIDENEIVLRMLDDLMMTYKYGYIPKCSHYHICKLNKAAAFGGAPQSTVIPLVSLPAAWILGKPTSRVMDYLHAVWLGRNERDCDEAFPECSDINVSQSDAFKGSTGAPPPSSTLFGFFNSTTAKPKVKMEDMNDVETDVDKILEDLRYLEENASSSSPTPTPTEGPETQSA